MMVALPVKPDITFLMLPDEGQYFRMTKKESRVTR